MEIIVKTFQGLEPVLAKELEDLGASNIEILTRAVRCEGDKRLLYRANYELRTALRVMTPFHSFKTKHENHFYKKMSQIDWAAIFDLDQTFAINAVTQSKYMNHSKYLALKAKDAIVDQFRDRNDGVRPSIDVRNPDIRFEIHLSSDNLCTLSIDSTGEPLFKRGYRVASVEAPLNEVLSAGLVQLTGWAQDCDFVDPMCGSGTNVIEAAMLAYRIPAQKFREGFAFQKWKDYDESLWRKIKMDALGKQIDFPHRIAGYDHNRHAIRNATENVRAAGLQNKVQIEQLAFEDLIPEEEKGVLLMNPPYDERMAINNIEDLYKGIGDQMKQHFKGWTAFIISSNMAALKRVGLRPSRKMNVHNGALECKFLKYELYSGSKKQKKQDV